MGYFQQKIKVPIIELPKRRNGADIVEVRGLSLTEIEKLKYFIRLKRVAIDAIALVEQQKEPTRIIVQKGGGEIPIDGMILEDGLSVSYKYPPAIEREEIKLRKLKTIMQIDGRARRLEKPCLITREAK